MKENIKYKSYGFQETRTLESLREQINKILETGGIGGDIDTAVLESLKQQIKTLQEKLNDNTTSDAELSELVNEISQELDSVTTLMDVFALKTELPDLTPYLKIEDADLKYATKDEIPAEQDLTPYMKTADADATYQPKGDYALKSEIPTEQDLTPYMKTADADATYQPKGDYATKDEIVGAFKYGGSVATHAALPTTSELGVVYNVEEDDHNYYWNGTTWNIFAPQMIIQTTNNSEIDTLFI